MIVRVFYLHAGYLILDFDFNLLLQLQKHDRGRFKKQNENL